jgi:hypothetical protein
VSDFASLSGVPITRLHLVVPALGMWHADVNVAEDVSMPPGMQVLQLSGSSWSCTSIRAIVFAGARSTRLIAGTAGWRKVVPAKQYASPIGVPTATVLGDVAGTVGEAPPVLDSSVPVSLGTGYVRQTGAASLVLNDLQDRGVLQWWVDSTGTVQTMPRPATPIVSPFVAEEVHGAPGWYRIATEFPGDWQPGSSFAGVTVSGTISRVEHRIEREQFWTEVLAA